MNTTIHTTRHSARRLTATLKCLLPVMAAGALASCGTQSIAMSQSESVAPPSTAPVRIWHHPPAELPRGVADDAPTNGWEGMWGSAIEFKDAEGVIPLLEISLSL